MPTNVQNSADEIKTVLDFGVSIFLNHFLKFILFWLKN
jgi:hypothetical protein